MNFIQKVIPVIFMLIVSASVPAQNFYPPLPKMAAADLKEDIRILKKVLEANHPSLYWYTSKDSIDYYFETTIASIKTDCLN
jgi:hypothetical protein